MGALEVRVGEKPVVIAGPKQRAVVAMLALQSNHVVSVTTLVEAVWGDPVPDRAEHTLQQHVSAVRKLFEAASDTAGSSLLLTRSPGYVLSVDTLDADAFTSAATVGRQASNMCRWPEAIDAFDEALGYWRGPALADARDSERLQAASVRLEEDRLGVLEARFDALLEAGQARDVVAEAEHLVGEYPLRERFRAQLMLALYRCGRQADALAAYQAARRVLIDELGIEPSAALRELEQAILQQSPSLDAGGPAAASRELYATFRADTRTVAGRVVLPDGQSVVLGDGVTIIGRDPSAQIHLVDSRVSRRHAEINNTGGRAVLRDLGSTNGTTVNGAPADGHVLSFGDVISVGGVELVFRAGGP